MMYQTYSDLLRKQGLGLGLYQPVGTHRIKIGSVGYFDGNGVWHEIIRNIRAAEPHLQPFNYDTKTTSDTLGRTVVSSKNIKAVGAKLAATIEYIF